jgi:Right handed beta helix region
MPPRRLLALALAGLVSAPVIAAPGPKGPPPHQKKRGDVATAPFPRALLLNGEPFPKAEPFVGKFPDPKRSFYVAVSGPQGDGSQAHPWNDLRAALRNLRPGDQLHILHGEYEGGFAIDDKCQDGTAEAPIQVFFHKSGMLPSESGPALSVGRSFWYFRHLSVSLGEHEGPGLEISSHDILIDGAFIYRGRGPGVRVAPGASRVTIANADVLKIGVAKPGPDAVGIEIAPRTREVRIVASRLYQNPAGSIRVEAARDEPEAADLTFSDNSIRDDGGPGLALLGGEHVRVARNTIFYGRQTRVPSRAIVLEAAHDVTIENNRIADAAEAIRVGLADAKGGPYLRSQDVTIARNAIDTTYPRGTAIDIEAGRKVRITNNVIEGYDDAITVFGSPPQTETVSVANNLVLSVSDVAFVLADSKSATYFDNNVFSPRAESVDVEVGKKTIPLAQFLKGGTMPHTKIVKGVTLEHRDLGRVGGAATVDQGKAIEGISFKGSAPDIGVAEK